MRKSILLIILCMLLAGCSSSVSKDSNVVTTSSGEVQGVEKGDVYTYLGIPYAEAKEMFVPAEPVSWDGIYEADSYGKTSYQGTIIGMKGYNGPDNSNNCQNLNIWTPNHEGKRPVMVWLHGGGFALGSANESTYDGSQLSSSQDVVVVGINHRLNVFGHLDLSVYGDKYKYSANVGMLDIQMALEWIQENIEQFGGDPDNVTIFGQSGGGAKVLTLMSTPYAEGLFHKAIVESGATEMMGVNFTSKEISQRIAELTLEYLNISPDHIEEIQNVGYEELLEASDRAREQTGMEYNMYLYLSTDYGIDWGPVIDGDYLPTAPVTEDGFAESARNIPLLIGSNFSEWTHWLPLSHHDNITPEQEEAFIEAYPERPVSDVQYTDTYIRLPTLKIMSYKADQNGAQVYAYLFNYGSDPNHCAELSYIFGNGSELSKIMQEAWANFAINGKPNPEWEAYTRENGATMIFDEDSHMVYHHDEKLMKLLEPEYTY